MLCEPPVVAATIVATVLLFVINGVVVKSARPKTFGDYPATLVRFFSSQEYAEAFLAGSVRFVLLDQYIETNEAESVLSVHLDAEGNQVGQSEAPGDMNYQVVGATPTYIVSFTDPEGADIRRLKEKFGPYVVRITDPVRLGQALTDALQRLGGDHPLNGRIVEAARVTYDEGGRRDAEPDIEETFKASYSQKKPRYAEENEVRLVTFVTKPVSRADAERTITIEIGPLNYAELLGSTRCRSRCSPYFHIWQSAAPFILICQHHGYSGGPRYK